MVSFDIDDKELWIAALQKAGVFVAQQDDGSQWVEVDALFDYLMRTRAALQRGDGA